MNGIKQYFEDNAKQWMLDGYNNGGYNYPTGFHRVRVVSKFISALKKKKLHIIDLGCGGGNLTFHLAKAGHTVVGVDQSHEMIDLAKSRKTLLSKNIQNRIEIIHSAINGKMNLGEKFDVVVAMGFIGYLPNDKIFFDTVNKLLKPNGYLFVSCRNRLFNMNSVSSKTETEIKNGTAQKLIKELRQLYVPISIKDTNKFIESFKKTAKYLPEKVSFDDTSALSPSEAYAPYTTASDSKFEQLRRQHTPKQLKTTALRYGLKHVAYYGIHPHLLDPNLNKMLPPQLFNQMSACLEALEHLPISLAWSSVFIEVFYKKARK